jgi:hypothetical protein
MMLSFDLFMQDKSIQPLMSLWDNSFMKKINNFYAMARNMKKKFYLLKPNALLKVMMKLTPTINDEGPAIIAVNKVIGCGNVLTKNLASIILKLTSVPN